MGSMLRGAVAVCALCACTSVKMVQRDGCWVKKTERTLGGTTEELGFCEKPAPLWSEDRLARLVQECMAQADYRWQNRALAAWSRNEPIPPAESDESIAKTCIGQASAALGLEAENGALKSRLADLSQDRDALKAVADKDREQMYQSSDKMVTALGEAAKKPAPNATATATSTGTAKTESDMRSAQQPGEATAPVILAPGNTVAVAPVCAPRTSAGRRLARRGKPACEPATPASPPASPDPSRSPAPLKSATHAETVMK